MSTSYYNQGSWDGYEIPAAGTYTDLKSSSVNRTNYDDLNFQQKGPNSKQTKSGNMRAFVITLVVFTSTLTAGLIGTVIFFLQRIDELSVCFTKDCGIGKCYLNTDYKALCVCPHGRTGDRCEILEFRVSEIRTNCPTNWSSHDMWCYKDYSSKKTWFRARDFCRSMGADLVSVHNTNEDEFLIGQFPLAKRNYWMGLHIDENYGVFTWSDGSLKNYTNWHINEPNNFNQNEKCAHFGPDFLGEWNDNNCFMSLGFICKVNRTTRCGSGSWLFHNGSCYLLSTSSESNSTVNWNDARRFCQRNGADLTNIQSRNEYSFLLSMATQSSYDILWIGLNDRERSGNYRWTDGTSPTFLSWNIGEPNNANDRCVGISSVYGNWVDEHCDRGHGFICEKVSL